MVLKLAICQVESSDDPVENMGRIEASVSENPADVYLFPELFLTRYGNMDFDDDVLTAAVPALQHISRIHDVALAVGMPFRDGDELYNSLMFVTPDKTTRYDKMYLANFAPYNEEVFEPGKHPAMVEWKGVKIGLLVCYDIMFPEIHRYYATHGADIVLMASASAEGSRNAMETIVPARSLENTVYTAFCNNIGNGPAGPFFGGSMLVGPLGNRIIQLEDRDYVLIVDIDPDAISDARKIRHHLKDLRSDIAWD